MGQKVNPHGARVGVIKNWDARWYADKKDFADNLVQPFHLEIRQARDRGGEGLVCSSCVPVA